MVALDTTLSPAETGALVKLFAGAEPGPLLSCLGFVPSEDDWHLQIDRDPDLASGLKLGAFCGNRLVAGLLGVHRPWKTDRADLGYVKWVYVEPAFRRRGIGRALLREAQTWFSSRGTRRLEYGAASPIYLLPGVWQEDAATRGLLEGEGWTMVSERISLRWPLDALAGADVSPPDGVEICICRDGGLAEAVRGFIERTFSLSWALECGPAFKSQGSARALVALDAGSQEVLGFAAIHTTNPNWFGPMGVSESARGRGIGRALLVASGCLARSFGSTELVIPWANEAFYVHCLGPLPRVPFAKMTRAIAPGAADWGY